MPILGRVAAGLLAEAIEQPEDTVRVDRVLLGGAREVFGLRISGESMIKAGINDGDYVFVRKQIEARKGDIIVALVGEEATCKYYYPGDRPRAARARERHDERHRDQQERLALDAHPRRGRRPLPQVQLKPSVILWDLMDTLVRDPFFTHMAPFFGLGFDELLAQKHPTHVGGVRARHASTSRSCIARFFRDGRSYRRRRASSAARAHAYAWIEGMEPLCSELHARGVQMHLLSNYPHWYRLCDERLGVSRYVRAELRVVPHGRAQARAATRT